MASTQTVRVSSFPPSSTSLQSAGRYFYFFMSLMVAAAVVYGFGHTVDANLIHATPPRPVLLWVHATLFSGWVAFYILQSALVRVRKVGLHRTLGWAGAALGTAMVVVGFWVAMVMAQFEATQLHRDLQDASAFLAIPFLDMVTFGTCLALAIVWRKRPERHRRLLLVATCALTAAAFGRMPAVRDLPLLGFYYGVDALILLGALRDWVVQRRIHAVYLTALPVMVAAQATALQIYGHRPAFWMSFVHKLLA